MVQRLIQLFLISVFALSLTACFHIPVQQGNIVTAGKVKQLHIGMSRGEVYKLFGQPILNDIYNANSQLFYPYSMQPEWGRFKKRWLVVLLYNNQVKKFYTSDNLPGSHVTQ